MRGLERFPNLRNLFILNCPLEDVSALERHAFGRLFSLSLLYSAERLAQIDLSRQRSLKCLSVLRHNLRQLRLPRSVVDLDLREGGEESEFDFRCIRGLGLESLRVAAKQYAIENAFKFSQFPYLKVIEIDNLSALGTVTEILSEKK